MRRNDVKPFVAVVLIVASFLTLGSGLVMLLGLHMGEGAFRPAALGLSRLTWLNVHRLPALIVVAGLGLHIALNWKAFAARLRRAVFRQRGSREFVEPILYVAFWTAAITGLVGWLLLDGSAPLGGPVALARLPHAKHHVVDVHHLTGLLALALAAHHVGHRWHRMLHGVRSAWQARGRGGVQRP
jgi:hypothetical protein